MHGLPDGAAFGVEGGEGGKDFAWAGLACFMLPELILFPADEGAHGVFVDDQAGEPEVGFAVFLVIRVHLYRKILQAFSVSLINRLFLGNVLVQVRDLSPDDTGDDVGHTVVKSDLLMLVPGGGFAALGGPLAHLVGVFQAVGQEHAPGGAGDDLVAVEGDAVIVPEGAGLFALIGGAEGLGRVLDDEGAVAVADLPEFVDLARCAVKVGNHDELHIRIDLKGLFQGFRTHVPGVGFRINKNCFAVLVRDRVDRGVEGHIAAEHLMPFEGAVIGSCLAVETLSGQTGREMERSSTGREADRVLHTDVRSQLFLYLIDVCANGGNPVGVDGLIHPLFFVPMHGGGGKPDFVLKGFYSPESGIMQEIHKSHSSLLFLCFIGRAAQNRLQPGFFLAQAVVIGIRNRGKLHLGSALVRRGHNLLRVDAGLTQFDAQVVAGFGDLPSIFRTQMRLREEDAGDVVILKDIAQFVRMEDGYPVQKAANVLVLGIHKAVHAEVLVVFNHLCRLPAKVPGTDDQGDTGFLREIPPLGRNHAVTEADSGDEEKLKKCAYHIVCDGHAPHEEGGTEHLEHTGHQGGAQNAVQIVDPRKAPDTAIEPEQHENDNADQGVPGGKTIEGGVIDRNTAAGVEDPADVADGDADEQGQEIGEVHRKDIEEEDADVVF